MAIEDNGRAEVLKKIWVEPSGEAFNAISLRPGDGQPDNPMINAGAIATTSMVEGRTARQKICRILDGIGRYAGRSLSVDQVVYQSESQSGDRNRTIAYLLKNFNIIESDPIPSVEAYFMQCSISITCRDLGVMAATLANAGVNPVTGARAIIREYVQCVLSVMGSCGMYDAAGEWIYQVGMPAKSGVSAGILAVLPGQLGIGVFSPRWMNAATACVESSSVGKSPHCSTCICSMLRRFLPPSCAREPSLARYFPTGCVPKATEISWSASGKALKYC
jgi:glutaminase